MRITVSSLLLLRAPTPTAGCGMNPFTPEKLVQKYNTKHVESLAISSKDDGVSRGGDVAVGGSTQSAKLRMTSFRSRSVRDTASDGLRASRCEKEREHRSFSPGAAERTQLRRKCFSCLITTSCRDLNRRVISPCPSQLVSKTSLTCQSIWTCLLLDHIFSLPFSPTYVY